MKLISLMSCSAALLFATPAQAVEYLVDISGNGLSANGSITTDGTIGILSRANITNWVLNLNDGFGVFTLNGLSNSGLRLEGSGLSASATDLFFNFSGTGFALFQNPSPGSGINFLCFAGQSCDGTPSEISISVSNFGGGISQSGVQSVARIGVNSAVPEPAAWAMMLLGFGLVGGAMRAAKRRQNLTVSYG